MKNVKLYSEAVIEGISVPVGTSDTDVLLKAKQKMKRTGIADFGTLHFRLYKKSIDARKKKDIRIVCSVLCSSRQGETIFREEDLIRAGIRPFERTAHDPKPDRSDGSVAVCRLKSSPLVVGMGPAGLFCAYVLAKNGYEPILIDRGDCISDRAAAVERFCSDGVLDTESNVQFGAGGAGTFSDGKLLTRISDPRCVYVLEMLENFGAPDDILIKAKPHVGTDVLRVVVQNILDEIEKLGGKLLYRTKLTDIYPMRDGGFTVRTNNGDMEAGAVVLAIGNGARDTFEMLLSKDLSVVAKPISVGVRIEHRREDIDKMLYGDFAGHPDLGSAEYHLSDTSGERGVYTFCMCPGGEVMAASTEEGGVVVNGMSYRTRNGSNSNSAVAVSVGVEDYEDMHGSKVLGALAFQRMIESAAFVAGGSDYSVAVQTVGDFLGQRSGAELLCPTIVKPSYRGGEHYRLASMDSVLPNFVTATLRNGLRSFDRKLPGFAMPEALLSAAETRTSSPVRIMRGKDMCAVGMPGVYPCGEGAGYAGGITSAAVDGIRVAEAIMKVYDRS